jgi:cytochrome c peroxidase
VGGQSTPSEAKQKQMQELISKDYVAPPEGEKKPRGRPRKATAGAESPAMTMSVAAARSAVASNGDGHPGGTSALMDVVAAYVRRLPADRSLSMEDLEAITARIKAMLS